MKDVDLRGLQRLRVNLDKQTGRIQKLCLDLHRFRKMVNNYSAMEKSLEQAGQLCRLTSELIQREIANEVANRQPQEGRTISRSKLANMSVANSPDLPGIVNDNGVLRQWVGIGWIDLNDPPTGREPIVTDP